MVDEVIRNLEATRSNINRIFSSWYSEILQLAQDVGVEESVPRQTNLQRNRSNVPSETPEEHYRRAIAIPLLDSLNAQLKQRLGDAGPQIKPYSISHHQFCCYSTR